MTTKPIKFRTPPPTPPIDRLALVDRVTQLTTLGDRVTEHAATHSLVRTAGLAIGTRCYAAAKALREALEDGASDPDLFGLSLIVDAAEANALAILARTDFADIEHLATGRNPVVADAAATQP